MHIQNGGERTNPLPDTLCRRRTPPGPLAGCGEVGRVAEISTLPAQSLVADDRGFRFTSPPAAFLPSLPGLKRCDPKELLPSVGTLAIPYPSSNLRLYALRVQLRLNFFGSIPFPRVWNLCKNTG